MNLHTLHNPGNGTWDVVHITDDNKVEYVSEDFMDLEHARAYIAGWHDGREYLAPPKFVAPKITKKDAEVSGPTTFDEIMNNVMNRRAD